MKASVIIPYYDRFDHLLQTLHAVSIQSLSNNDYEIIVIDDGSSQSIEKRIPSHVRLIQTSHRGAAAARNSGIAVAKGEILIFLDSDIVVGQSFVENHWVFHEEHPQMIGLGFRRHMNSEGAVQSIDTRLKLLARYGKKISDLRHPWFMTYTCNVSAPSELASSELFDENYIAWGLEDSEWAYRLYHRGFGFAFIENASTTHLYHDRTMTPQKFQGWKANLEYTIAKHSNLNVLEVFKDVFDPAKQADYFECYDKFEGA